MCQDHQNWKGLEGALVRAQPHAQILTITALSQGGRMIIMAKSSLVVLTAYHTEHIVCVILLNSNNDQMQRLREGKPLAQGHTARMHM